MWSARQFYNLRHWLKSLPISYRIAIGNTLVITIGAIGGTLITRHLASESADPVFILIFIGIGALLLSVTNFLIIKNALHPLSKLSQTVQYLEKDQSGVDLQILKASDPDISKLAITLDSLLHQLEERNLQLSALSARAINAQEEERRRIALTLHDETGQALSMLIINLDRLETQLPLETADLRAKLELNRQVAQRTLSELRKIIYDLRPSILDDLGLVPAIRWFARAHLEEMGIHAEIISDGAEEPLTDHITSTLFRITQEGLNNILKHSQATHAKVQLTKQGGKIELDISDDGCGFDVTKVEQEAIPLQHLGLLGIKERVELLSGKMIIESTPGEGTQIRVEIPTT